MDQGIPFSSAKSRDEVYAFIPQVKVPGFSSPFLACNACGIDDELIDWKDKKHSYKSCSLVKDVRNITGSENEPLFSIVRQWNTTDSAT